MATHYTEDKSKYRTPVSGTMGSYTNTYEVDDKIGRADGGIDKTAITDIIASSGVATLLPASPLGRRDYIKITNTGGVDVEVSNTTATGVAGVTVSASGGTWEENASGPFYIKSTGADSAVTVYERSSR